MPMLYAAPVVLIVAGRIRGCRPEERRVVTVIACLTTAALVPALLAGLLSDLMLVKGCAYACAVLAGTHWAMLLGKRPGRGGGGDDSGGDKPIAPEPFDWDDFERRFWDEVRRREREPVPA
jgi:hypothetical protein